MSIVGTIDILLKEEEYKEQLKTLTNEQLAIEARVCVDACLVRYTPQNERMQYIWDEVHRRCK